MNWNADYAEVINTNSNSFKRQNGIFTDLYDSAARFGEIEVFKH